MNKYWKNNLKFGFLGLAICSLFVVYQVVTDSAASPPPPLHSSLLTLLVALCPPSLLSVPFIDAEVGTSGFYFIWSFIGVLNAALYAAVGALIVDRWTKRG
jgi:hypothetical protein